MMTLDDEVLASVGRMWEHFEGLTIPTEADEQTRRAMRLAFINGTGYMFAASAIHASYMPDAEARVYLKRLRAELTKLMKGF